jgi:outer membrane receptor protein involved in Fe transport
LYPAPVKPGFEGELLNVAASIEYGFDVGGTLTGIFGYSDYDWTMYADLDSSPVQIIDAGFIESYEQSSVELRYASADDRALQFLLGAYYHSSELMNEQMNLVAGVGIGLGAFGFPVAGFDAGRLWSESNFTQDEDVVSVYGTFNWDVSDRVQIRGGVRFVESEKDHLRGGECLVRRSDGTYDDLDLVGNPNDFLLSLIGFCPTAVDPPRQSRSSDNVLPELSVQWSANGSTMLYAKVGNSAKSGGFVASTTVNPGFFEYDDETGTGYELGLKATLGDGKGELNVAVFRSEYDDLQLSSFDPDSGAAVVRNAGEIRSQGVEIEGRWAASDIVTLGGSIGFLDAEFTEFGSGSCYPGEPMNPDGVSCDKTGKTLPYSPNYSGNVYADINAPFGNELAFLGRIDVTFSDSYLTSATLDPLGEQDSFTKVNARVGIGNADGKWSLSVIGKNLTNEKINNFTEAFLGVYRGYMQEPRTIWVQGRYNFGQ